MRSVRVIEFIIQGLALSLLFLPFAFIGCPQCCGCACVCGPQSGKVVCIDNKGSCTLRVTVYDIASAGTCGASCLDLNGTYFLDSTTSPSVGICIWQYDFPSSICSFYTHIRADFAIDGGNDRRMSIRLLNAGETQQLTFFKLLGDADDGSPPNCCTWVDVATTNRSSSVSFGCNITSAYAEFTSSGL
jgi:hypothetical protein